MKGWSIEPNFKLPEGYSLREDGDFLYLYSGAGLVATFSAAGAVPGAILEACNDCCN